MNTKSKNRYLLLFIASCVNFVQGNAYIWTVFQPYVKEEFSLSTAASSQPFTLIIGLFAVGNIIGGKLQHKLGARATVLLGNFTTCLGFTLAAFAPYQTPSMLSVGYGILGGLGSGCACSILVAVPQAWFPEKRGMVTGISLGVVGLSGILMNPFCDSLLKQYGYRTAMLIVTLLYAAISLSGSWFIVEPPAALSIPMTSAVASKTLAASDFAPSDMLRTKAYYFIALSMALAVPAYILINPLMKSLGMERGLSSSAALSGILIASIMNTVGRFVAPWASDRFGRKQVLILLYIIAMSSILLLIAATNVLFIILISLVSFTYGGFVGVYPAMTADYFGIQYQAMNYGIVMLGYGFTSVLCTYVMDAVEHSAYGIEASFLIAGLVCLSGILVTLRIKPVPSGIGS